MKKSVSLARALREKDHLTSKLHSLHESIYINVRELRLSALFHYWQDVEVEASIHESHLNELLKIKGRLIEVRTALGEANNEIVGLIVKLKEVKSEIAWLKNLNTSMKRYRPRCHSDDMQISNCAFAIISGARKLQMIRELQEQANRIQDKLDDFNASHYVTIEIDD